MKRALITSATAAVIVAGSAGVASAAPVPESPVYCGPGLELVGGHCEPVTRIDLGGPKSDAVANAGVVILGVLSLIILW